MRALAYRATYNQLDTEIIRVRARSINAGYAKALKRAREPLGNGVEREIVRIEFWEAES